MWYVLLFLGTTCGMCVILSSDQKGIGNNYSELQAMVPRQPNHVYLTVNTSMGIMRHDAHTRIYS